MRESRKRGNSEEMDSEEGGVGLARKETDSHEKR